MKFKVQLIALRLGFNIGLGVSFSPNFLRILTFLEMEISSMCDKASSLVLSTPIVSGLSTLSAYKCTFSCICICTFCQTLAYHTNLAIFSGRVAQLIAELSCPWIVTYHTQKWSYNQHTGVSEGIIYLQTI